MKGLKNNDRGAAAPCKGPLPGIIIHDREVEDVPGPRILAFVWGGERPAAPTLPYGRLKGAA